MEKKGKSIDVDVIQISKNFFDLDTSKVKEYFKQKFKSEFEQAIKESIKESIEELFVKQRENIHKEIAKGIFNQIKTTRKS